MLNFFSAALHAVTTATEEAPLPPLPHGPSIDPIDEGRRRKLFVKLVADFAERASSPVSFPRRTKSNFGDTKDYQIHIRTLPEYTDSALLFIQKVP